MLHDFILQHREEIIALTRMNTSRRAASTESELDSGAHLFLDQLVEKLAHPLLTGTVERGAVTHGAALFLRGYTLSQVVHDYGDMSRAIILLAEEYGLLISVEEHDILNTCVDNATATAITEFARLQAVASRREETERAGVFAHELRNKLCSAQLGFQSIKAGKAPVIGGVSALVTRNLLGLEELIGRALVEVRLELGVNRQRIHLNQFMEEISVEGAIAAGARGISLDTGSVAQGVDLDADPLVLAGVISNLLQNAFKFTPQGGKVLLRTSAIDDRVLIDVIDGCGGLPKGKPEELFKAFEQRGHDRSGLGLGLYISRKGVEAHGGHLKVHDIPGMGCVFTADLPQLH